MHDGSDQFAPVASHGRGMSQPIARFVRSASVTFTWLAVLFLTTAAQHLLPRWHLITLLRKDSTNLHHLASDPIRVLITSLLWLDGAAWWPYLVAAFAWFIGAVLINPTFTQVGHLVALFVGLACYPLARGRPGPPVDPSWLLRTRRHAPPAA